MSSRETAGLQPLPILPAALAGYDTIIDARSPAEYADDHLPGALSYPVLSDEERARIGTVHKEVSAFEAKRAGGALVARHIAEHLEAAFCDRPRSWKPLVYCWRGGMRSGAFTHVLRSVGWSARQLVGGYKAWRGQVIAELETMPTPFSWVVICGRTGSGKSRLLEALRSAGAQVLDLEKMACHKGSILGDLPYAPQPSQKRFESQIWQALQSFENARPVFVEAESKRIGSLRVPERLMACMRASACVEVSLDLDARVALLREEYPHLVGSPDALAPKLESLAPLHSKTVVAHWLALAHAGRWDEFVERLLADHYDPAYQRSMFKNYAGAANAVRLTLDDHQHSAFARLARELAAWPMPQQGRFG